MKQTMIKTNNFFNLSAFYFFYFAAVGVYIMFLPKVLHDVGYSTSQIGVIFAIAPLMRFITPFLFLKHISLSNSIFIYSLSLSVLCSLLFYLTIDNFYLFLLNNVVLGMTLSLTLPFVETLALDTIGKTRYGKSRLYGSIGFMLVALLLGNYLTQSTIALHYYLGSTLLTTLFATLLILSYAKGENKKSDSCSGGGDFSLLKHWSFWVSLFLMQVSFGAFYNFFTIYETEHGISLEVTSYLWAFGVVCEIIMLYFQAPLIKNNLLIIIKFSIFITSFRWLLLYLFPENLTVAFISQSIHAFSFGLYHSAVIIYLYQIYTNKKLAQQFMFGVAYGLGGFVGAILAGWFYGEHLFLFSAAVALISALLVKKTEFRRQETL
jgi:PPP family 3-phenylpropionic acid transporter